MVIAEGKSGAIREAAAEQIAGVVKNQPTQFHVIVEKVSNMLYSSNWETRVAASNCLGIIARHCEHHTVESLKKRLGVERGDVIQVGRQTWKSLEEFDIRTVLKKARPLTASSGAEYKVGRQQDVGQQKKMLRARLGLDGISGKVINADDLIEDGDLAVQIQEEKEEGGESATALMHVMSAREKALAAQKAKRKGAETGSPIAVKRIKTTNGNKPSNGQQHPDQDYQSLWDETVGGRWPFQHLGDRLCIDLLDSSWERRHGAALGLREILRSHAACAGVNAHIKDNPTGWLASEGSGLPELSSVTAADVEQAQIDNSEWLEDCTIIILCVLALDRFGDYVSDDVVAPVRETAGQVLGIICQNLPSMVFSRMISSMGMISKSEHWESRHGALTGMKYALASREPSADVFDEVLTAVRRGLEDSMEDVRAISAECLIPCAFLFEGAPSSDKQVVNTLLWDAMLSLDPLNSATKSAAKLLEKISQQAKLPESHLLPMRVPRLWYHFHSKLTSVRQAVVCCYKQILDSEGLSSTHGTLDLHHTGFMLLLASIITDKDHTVAETSFEATRQIISGAQSELHCGGFFTDELLREMIILASFEPNVPLRNLMNLKLPQISEIEDMDEAVIQPSSVSSSDAPGRRLLICKLLGEMGATIPQCQNFIINSLLLMSESSSSLERQASGMITAYFGIHAHDQQILEPVIKKFQSILPESPLYDEMKPLYVSLKPKGEKFGISYDILTSKNAEELSAILVSHFGASGSKDNKAMKNLQTSITNLKNMESNMSVSVKASIAAAIVHSGSLPQKLSSIIQPLVAATRRESNEAIQRMAAEALAQLIWDVKSHSPSPSDKIIKNVCLFACQDSQWMLKASRAPSVLHEDDENSESTALPDKPQLSQITKRVRLKYFY